MSGQTKEPWKIFDEKKYFLIKDRDGAVVADDGSGSGEYNKVMSLSAGRRIVACVNHCVGIETEKLETSPFTYQQMLAHNIKLRQQRDNLLTSLRRVLPYIADPTAQMHAEGAIAEIEAAK